MAIRVFYPSFFARSHPYSVTGHIFDDDKDFTLPRLKLRQVSRKSDENWEKILANFFNSNEDAVKKTQQTKTNHFTRKFDLHGFEPGDIKVKTVGQKLIIEATKETNTEEQGLKSYSKKSFHHSIVLPENVKPDGLTSALNRKGELRINAPVMSIPDPEEKRIEVERQNSENDTSVQTSQEEK